MKRSVSNEMRLAIVTAALVGLLAARGSLVRSAVRATPPGTAAARSASVSGAVAPPSPTAGAAAPSRAMLLAKHDEDNDDVGVPPTNPKHGKHHKHDDEANYAGSFFSPIDASYFGQCYGGTDVSSLPPGLQKHVARTGHLPPGLEKQLARNGHLPPGLEKRMSPASPCLMQRLGPLPPDSRLYMLGRDAYLINYHTRAIIDVLRGAY